VRLSGFNGLVNTLAIGLLLLVASVGYSQALGWQARLTEASQDFVAIGDVGSRLPGQYATAQALAQSYATKPFGCVLLLGDNIYPHGEVDKYGDESFTKPYAPLLKAGVPFYVALGNHDVLFGQKQAQLAFYRMPAPYYTVKQGMVTFFVLDTNDFDATQQQWLKTELAASNAKWKVVLGHHPIWSSGLHGNDASLIKTLAPILTFAKVPLYLAGHDHEYERFKPINGLTQIVSGGGGASLRPFAAKPDARSLVRHVKHHFVRFTASPTRLQAIVLDPKLTTLDTFEIKPATEAKTPAPKTQKPAA
jgi:hypothetical protein